jgi:hypothetical protein
MVMASAGKRHNLTDKKKRALSVGHSDEMGFILVC